MEWSQIDRTTRSWNKKGCETIERKNRKLNTSKQKLQTIHKSNKTNLDQLTNEVHQCGKLSTIITMYQWWYSKPTSVHTCSMPISSPQHWVTPWAAIIIIIIVTTTTVQITSLMFQSSNPGHYPNNGMNNIKYMD